MERTKTSLHTPPEADHDGPPCDGVEQVTARLHAASKKLRAQSRQASGREASAHSREPRDRAADSQSSRREVSAERPRRAITRAAMPDVEARRPP